MDLRPYKECIKQSILDANKLFFDMQKTARENYLKKNPLPTNEDQGEEDPNQGEWALFKEYFTDEHFLEFNRRVAEYDMKICEAVLVLKKRLTECHVMTRDMRDILDDMCSNQLYRDRVYNSGVFRRGPGPGAVISYGNYLDVEIPDEL